MARSLRVEERQLMRLRQWAAGTSEEKANTRKYKKTASFTPGLNFSNRVRTSPSKPSSLYPSLKEVMEEPQDLSAINSYDGEEEYWVTVPSKLLPPKKPEPLEREKIAISRLGWNRDLSSVRKNHCRTDASLMSAAFLSKYYFLWYSIFNLFFKATDAMTSSRELTNLSASFGTSVVEENPNLPSLPRLKMLSSRN